MFEMFAAAVAERSGYNRRLLLELEIRIFCEPNESNSA